MVPDAVNPCAMNKTIYRISKMDCPSEENLIRMRLQDEPGIADLVFDIAGRTLTVYHEAAPDGIFACLDSLNLGTSIMETVPGVEYSGGDNTQKNRKQRKILWIVLAINFGFFLLEMASGILSKSMGLVADSLDMLADALVYSMSLMAVGAVVARKKRVALWSGIIQIILALLGLSEVVRRFIGLEIMPDFKIMIVVSLVALVANSICLWLLQRTQSKDAHIRASIIFSANDVIINLGVICAGLLVWWLDNNIPDLVIGIIVFTVVIMGAVRILKLSR